jgi:hypothetical protein
METNLPMHVHSSSRALPRQRGFALVLVLAFIALLVGIALAFLSNSLLQRQVSNASGNQIKVRMLADGATDSIVGGLKQEIVTGSNVTSPATGVTVYNPTSSDKMLPLRDSNLLNKPGLENLVRVSAITGGKGTDDASESRKIDLKRWNKPLFVIPTSATDTTPVTPFPSVPQWIYVQRDGKQVNAPSTSSSANDPSATIGRYAYVVYDEGGLLDINVAGYPDVLVGNNAMKRKIGLPYVNLTDLKNSAGNNLFTRAEAKILTDWRDYATGQAVSAAPTPESAYAQSILSNKTGFLQPSNTALASGQSDRKFVGRQQLIDFVINELHSTGTLNALQYLTTFSRGLDQPSYIPAIQSDPNNAPRVLATSKGGNSAVGGDKFINPSFPTVRVQTSFKRNDGSTANVGEPLVNKRFPLNRLAWITYQGPSAQRNTAATATTGSDGDIGLLKQNGITEAWLKQGTPENIQKYFGLSWDKTNNRWIYDVHVSSSSGNKIIMLVGRPTGTGADPTKYVQDANREPDFFELLKAGITLGSLGKAATTSNSTVPLANIPPGYNPTQVPVNQRYAFDSSVDYHIIQIGANILSEVNPTSFPVRIAFDDGSARGLWEFQGVTDLPYLQYVFNGVLRTQAPTPGPTTAAENSPFQYPISIKNGALTTPGNAYMIQVPAVWNPYDPNGTPGVLRPSQFRIVIDSNDPFSPIGSGDLRIWHGALGSTRTAQGGSGQDGLNPPNPIKSYDVTGGLGDTTEKPPRSGTPIFDAVKFSDGNGALFREPTVIFKARSAATGNATRVNAVTNPAPGNALPAPGDITSLPATPPSPGGPLPGEIDNSTGPWAPLVLGQFPLAFSDKTNIYYAGSGMIGLAAGNGDNRVYFTYRLQYQDPSNPSNWITYDTKYGRTTHGLFAFQGDLNGPSTRFGPCVIKGPQRGDFSPYSWASAIDPRTARFGLITNVINVHFSQAWDAYAPQWWINNSSGSPTVATDGILPPIRPADDRGFFFANFDITNHPPGTGTAGNANLPGIDTHDVQFPGYPDPANPTFNSGWTAPVTKMSQQGWMFAPGMYAQNNPSNPFIEGGPTIQPSYYADADGVVRRAAGAYVPSTGSTSASTTVGLPTCSINGYNGAPQTSTTPPSKGAGTNPANFAQSQSRPLLLHRPFRTVAELGYVFRDLPWKNLDFFTPESGDAALLDLFCINETSDPNGLVAGKVNLNTRQAPVLAAIISGAYVDDPKVTNTTVGSLSPTVATSIATALTARTANTTANTTAKYGPLQNVAELIGKWNSAAACAPPSGTTYFPSDSSNRWGIDLPASDYKDGKLSYTGFSGNTVTTSGKDLSAVFTPANRGTLMESLAYVKRLREAPIRALADTGQTRVWNLMIDVIAQSGRSPQSATASGKFVVEGEQRYWIHVAIDRLTGQVIDKQIEVVKE